MTFKTSLNLTDYTNDKFETLPNIELNVNKQDTTVYAEIFVVVLFSRISRSSIRENINPQDFLCISLCKMLKLQNLTPANLSVIPQTAKKYMSVNITAYLRPSRFV